MSLEPEEKELWQEFREEGRKKRAANLESSTELLKERGIPFTSHNNGVHLVVDSSFDFWPSTGKWIERDTGKKGRGVFRLLQQFERGSK